MTGGDDKKKRGAAAPSSANLYGGTLRQRKPKPAKAKKKKVKTVSGRSGKGFSRRRTGGINFGRGGGRGMRTSRSCRN
tara:strand:- start:593 stop:826 length:234 start_codon:yes stop_codon:yes gene_type:complete